MEADISTARFVYLCQGARTLDSHAQHIARATSGAELPIRETLRALVDFGLLRPVASPVVKADIASRAPRSIETVGIVTANRPETVARGLADAIAHVLQYGRNVRFIVADGSSQAESLSRTQAVLKNLSDRASISYVGPAESRTIVSRLARLGFNSARLTPALCTGTAGANRNLLLLLTAGHPLLMVDDDMRWVTWRLAEQDDRPVFGGHTDLREFAFFSTRAEALAAAPHTAIDLLSAHETLLGWSTRSLMAQRPDLTQACGHLLHALSAEIPPTVRVTLAGVAGDAGTYCPYQILFVQGQTQTALRQSQEVFERALSSRETHRIARQPVVTHDPQCMALCMGLGNTDVLPPFLPAGRNEDGVFGAMLALADPRALFGHLPWGIVHDSDRPSVRPDGRIASATQTRVADIVLALIRLASASPLSSSAGRLQRTVRSVSELCNLAPHEFRGLLTQIVVDVRSRQLVLLEKVLSSDPSSPEYWRRAVDIFRDQLLASIVQPDFFCPVEFKHLKSPEAGFLATQTFLREFCELLTMWPDVWEQARQIGPELLPSPCSAASVVSRK